MVEKTSAWRTLGKRLVEMLAIAITYLASAQLGFLVAIPPGNVTPVWPPSGLALAAALALGYRSGVGIWLGSFCVNTLFFSGTEGVTPAVLLTASSIAAGSTLQALAAAALMRRMAGSAGPQGLPDLVKFFAIAALSCLIASVWGTTSLTAAGRVAWEQYAYTWVTWWLGDFAGILVITPALLVLRQRLAAKAAPMNAAFPLLGLAAGLALIGSFIVWRVETNAFETAFHRHSEDMAALAAPEHRDEPAGSGVGGGFVSSVP